MTKKYTIILSMMMLANIALHAGICGNSSDSSEPINLNVSKIDPGKGKDKPHKGPIQVPEISLDGHTLYFFTPCDGCTLNLVDKHDVVIYTLVIPTGTTSLVLPSNLFGEFELQIICGNYCFWGYMCIS